MPEIQLPTAAKQDAILAAVNKTDKTLGTTGLIVTGHASAILLDITGPGCIFLIMNDRTTNNYIRIETDNNGVITYQVPANTSLPINIPFSNSIKISADSANWAKFLYYLD